MDVLFQEYILKYGDQLSEHDLDELENLLTLDDPVLFDAFSGKTKLADTGMDALFTDIKARIAKTS